MKPTVLPENILRAMSPEARKSLGKAGKTTAECQSKIDDKSERTLQNQMAALLNQRNIFFFRSPMHKRVTAKVGTPDFIILLPHGCTLLVEAKTETGKLSDAQEKTHDEIWKKANLVVKVVRSLSEFKAKLDEALNN